MNNYTKGNAKVHHNIRQIMKSYPMPLKGWHIQARYQKLFGKRYSESTITARLREMKDVICNLSTYTYTLEGSYGKSSGDC